MNRNALQLLVVCQLATFVIAGVVTTIGLIVPAAADYFQVPVTEMAAQFTWFTGAGLVGQLLAFFVFDYFSIKRVLLLSHLACGTALMAIHLTTNISVLSIWFVLFGIGISTAVCGSSTLITRLWQGGARNAAIVAQDAMFNGGGVIFAALTTWMLARGMPFSSTYVITAGIIAVVLLLILVSDFSVETPSTEDEPPTGVHTEWNARILLIGLSLLLFMLAKISIFIWAPQYIVARFDTGPEIGGAFMSHIFTTALLGAIAGTWLVAKIRVRLLVYGFVLLSFGAAAMMTRLETLDYLLSLAFVYGLSVSATFNAYVAFALTQVRVPTHRNIAYMLMMSSLGSAIAPLVSSRVVDATGDMQWALVTAAGLLFVVIVLLVVVEMVTWLAAQRTGHPATS